MSRSVQQAEQFAIAGADALIPAFPLRDHVGVDADPFTAAHPGQTGELVSGFLLGPAAVLARLLQSRPSRLVHPAALPSFAATQHNQWPRHLRTGLVTGLVAD
jgi:hypothetical protein